MKFLHTGDLHIGKSVNEFSMLEDQRHILAQIREIAVKEQVDAVVIAGDVYDRSIPSTEAVNLLDEFLTALAGDKIKVLLISGNHDSAERVGFANQILEKQGLYIGTASDELKMIEFQDKYGSVQFVLLPFVKPALVGASECHEAVKLLLERNGCDVGSVRKDKTRHVLVTHFFVTGAKGQEPELSDSESTVSVGGLDRVGAGLFGYFDYVALGHIHKPQKMGEGIYYAGSPLAYSFSECNQVKSVNVVTLEESVEVRKVPLKPLHQMRSIKGKLEDLMAPQILAEAATDDYIQAILTNREELLDPIGVLRSVYPNLMQIQLEKNEMKEQENFETKAVVMGKSTLDLFREFYILVREEPMDQLREQVIIDCLEKAGKGEP